MKLSDRLSDLFFGKNISETYTRIYICCIITVVFTAATVVVQLIKS